MKLTLNLSVSIAMLACAACFFFAKTKRRSIMPKPQVLVTPEAKEILEAAKKQQQGYSECLLASEAIKEKYGKSVKIPGNVRAFAADIWERAGHIKQDAIIMAGDAKGFPTSELIGAICELAGEGV